MMEDTGEDILRQKPNVVYTFFKRLGQVSSEIVVIIPNTNFIYAYDTYEKLLFRCTCSVAGINIILKLNPFLPDCKTTFSRIFYIFLSYF